MPSTVKANLTDITEKLDKANGTAVFSIGAGNIDDAQKLARANKITRIMFSAVAIVDKVAQSLKIDALKGSKNDSGIGYDSFDGDLLFADGKMTVKKTDLASKMITMKVTGTADFKADKLDMKASVQPGVNKPVIMKITGTTGNPKGSIDIAASAVSIFGADSPIGKIGAILSGTTTQNGAQQSTGTVSTESSKPGAELIKSLTDILKKK